MRAKKRGDFQPKNTRLTVTFVRTHWTTWTTSGRGSGQIWTDLDIRLGARGEVFWSKNWKFFGQKNLPAASNSNVQICPAPSRGCPGCPVCPDKSHGPARVFGAVSWFFSATFWLTGCGIGTLCFSVLARAPWSRPRTPRRP